MRVLHWFPNYFHGGGVANAVTGLAHAQANVGLDVAIAGVADQRTPLYGAQPEHPGVDLLRWRPAFTQRVGDLVVRRPSAAAAAELEAWRPDVVHLHAEFSPDNLWAIRLFRRPMVLSFHGALHPEIFQKGKRARKQAYLHLAKRVLYGRVAVFHALSPAEAMQIEVVVPGASVATIPLGAVPAASARDGTRRDGGLHLLFVGRLDCYTKGLDLLLDAFAAARTDGNGLGLLKIVGPDWKDGRRQLQQQITSLGLSDCVSLVGAVPLGDVGRLIDECDFYVQLSRHDAFPLSVVDALVAGKPAVLSSAIGTTSYPQIASLPHVRIVDPHAVAAAEAFAEFSNRWDEISREAEKTRPQVLEFFDNTRIAGAHHDVYRTLV